MATQLHPLLLFVPKLFWAALVFGEHSLQILDECEAKEQLTKTLLEKNKQKLMESKLAVHVGECLIPAVQKMIQGHRDPNFSQEKARDVVDLHTWAEVDAIKAEPEALAILNVLDMLFGDVTNYGLDLDQLKLRIDLDQLKLRIADYLGIVFEPNVLQEIAATASG